MHGLLRTCWLVLALVLALPAQAAPLRVVATFTILADLSREIGGERVTVRSLVGPDSDAHAYQPSPADAREIARAQLVVANGLGFEGWIDRLLRAAGFRGSMVIASEGVQVLAPLAAPHDGGHDGHALADPHAWQDLGNAQRYAQNIAAAMIRLDPAGRAHYQHRLADLLSRIDALDAEMRSAITTLPAERRRVVTSHDAFAYLGRAYGLVCHAPSGVSSAAQPSAAQVAQLIRQIRSEGIPAVFIENISDPRLLERIRKETGARIGGTLYSDALSGPDGVASTYLAMMAHNLRTLADALRP